MAEQRLSDWLEAHGEGASAGVVRRLEERAEKAERRVRILEEALRVAADDLLKAANQFRGLIPGGSNWSIFESKAARAHAALASEGTPEEASGPITHEMVERGMFWLDQFTHDVGASNLGERDAEMDAESFLRAALDAPEEANDA